MSTGLAAVSARHHAAVSAASSPTAPRGGERFPLDGLRAFAAISVLFFHAYQNNVALGDSFAWTGLSESLVKLAELAVDLFFVISGFVLWLPVARAAIENAVQRSGLVMLRRRVARLVPLYVAVFLFVWALANPGLGQGWEDLVRHLTFTQIYSEQYIFYTVGPAWSLAVEFHFYALIALMIPVVGFLAARAGRRLTRSLIVSLPPVALICAGLGFLFWATVIEPQPADAWTVWFSAPSKAQDFGLGMLLAVLAAGGASVGPRMRRSLICGGLAIIVGSVLVRESLPELQRHWLHVTLAVASVLLIAAIVLHRGTQPRWLSARPLVFIGTVSYSFYLLHEFVMLTLRGWNLLPSQGSTWGVLATTGLVFVATLMLASLTYRFIELPAQRFMHFYDSRGRIVDNYAHVTGWPETVSSPVGPDPQRQPSAPHRGGTPAVADAYAERTPISARTRTVAMPPAVRHASSTAPFADTRRAATTHGSPGRSPFATSAAASAAASAAPAARA